MFKLIGRGRTVPRHIVATATRVGYDTAYGVDSRYGNMSVLPSRLRQSRVGFIGLEMSRGVRRSKHDRKGYVLSGVRLVLVKNLAHSDFMKYRTAPKPAFHEWQVNPLLELWSIAMQKDSWVNDMEKKTFNIVKLLRRPRSCGLPFDLIRPRIASPDVGSAAECAKRSGGPGRWSSRKGIGKVGSSLSAPRSCSLPREKQVSCLMLLLT